MTARNPGLAEKRVKSGVSKVVYGNPPKWLSKKVAAATKRLGGNARAFYPMLEFLLSMEKKYGQSCFYAMLDHAGKTHIDGKLAYVFEPYLEFNDARLPAAVANLRAELDCNVEVSKTSWHFPEETIRICFTEKTR
jgi:hypothetical protein